ncbi:MAG: Insulinase (Peptidase M16) [Pycnora praestabilis]|nr:MAG: Insulinase (Peptidase M16) [Pycnora praestabilis]
MADSRSVRTAERLTDHLETPALDDRSYRVIRLSNKLEALLVHDPDTDKASAALDVNVGSFGDADNMPGMAHAVEHLLFMGTEKFPVENAYSQYLSAHSGYSNAYTAATETNYFFEVAASSSSSSEANDAPADAKSSPLYGALDRFAQFFIAPLFLSTTLDRELNAVDSENKKNLQNDLWRLNQLNKSFSNPRHPYSHFSTGNLETLRDEPRKRGVAIREEFMKFHEKNYSSNRMKLVVLGRESLDELETWVGDLFSGVRNKNLAQDRWDGVPLLTGEDKLIQVFAKPVMESRTLDIYFPYQDEEDLYESQPGRYLSHLIGHEGPGSILAYIKAKGWANGLSAGPMAVCPGSALFAVSIRLTEDGLNNYQEVVKVIFQYISLLHDNPPQEWIVSEMKGMAEVDFRFRQKSPASKFTSRLSSIMQKPLPREWLLSGSTIIRKFNPEAISKGLSYLRPDNFRLTLVSQDFTDLDQKEKWYGTEYKSERIPEDFLAEVKKAAAITAETRLPDLHLPHKNEFIPTKLEVERKETENPLKAPKLIRNDEGVRVWWKKDDRFWVPKANVCITLRNPLVYATPEHCAMTALFVELVKDALVEYSYDAEIAGLDYGLSNHSQGLDVELSGYNDKMSVLLEKVLINMRDLEVKADRFRIVKERLLRGLRNWDFQQPYQQVGEFTRCLSTEKRWTKEQQLAELLHLTPEDITAFYPQVLRQFHVEALVHGNLYKEDALRIADLVESTLKHRPLPQAQWNIQRNLIFPKGSNFLYPRTLKDPGNVNHCIEFLLFIGDIADRTLRAKLLLLSQMTDEPAFDQLRTKEQLGYIVFTGPRIAATTMGYRVIIQSERPADYLEKRINVFLKRFGKTLEEMAEDEFEGHKRSLINKMVEKLKNLGQESNRFWTHIGREYLDFEQVDYEVAHTKRLSKTDLIEFFQHYIHPSSADRSKLSVHMLAQASPKAIADTITPAEQTEKVIGLLGKYLNSQGVEVEPGKLNQRFAGVDISGGDQEGIVGAIKAYLLEDLKLDDARMKTLVEQGQSLLETVLPSLGIQVIKPEEQEAEDQTPAEEASESRASDIIEHVRDFKARLPVSAGARPVRDLSEFEETGSKL